MLYSSSKNTDYFYGVVLFATVERVVVALKKDKREIEIIGISSSNKLQPQATGA